MLQEERKERMTIFVVRTQSRINQNTLHNFSGRYVKIAGIIVPRNMHLLNTGICIPKKQ